MAKRERTATQFLDALPSDGERRLLLAVLLDAMRSLSRPPPRTTVAEYKSWVRDREWLMSDDASLACGFLSICNALGLEPDYVRRQALAALERTGGIRVRRYASSAADSWAAQSRQQSQRGRRPDDDAMAALVASAPTIHEKILE